MDGTTYGNVIEIKRDMAVTSLSKDLMDLENLSDAAGTANRKRPLNTKTTQDPSQHIGKLALKSENLCETTESHLPPLHLKNCNIHEAIKMEDICNRNRDPSYSAAQFQNNKLVKSVSYSHEEGNEYLSSITSVNCIMNSEPASAYVERSPGRSIKTDANCVQDSFVDKDLFTLMQNNFTNLSSLENFGNMNQNDSFENANDQSLNGGCANGPSANYPTIDDDSSNNESAVPIDESIIEQLNSMDGTCLDVLKIELLLCCQQFIFQQQDALGQFQSSILSQDWSNCDEFQRSILDQLNNINQQLVRYALLSEQLKAIICKLPNNADNSKTVSQPMSASATSDENIMISAGSTISINPMPESTISQSETQDVPDVLTNDNGVTGLNSTPPTCNFLVNEGMAEIKSERTDMNVNDIATSPTPSNVDCHNVPSHDFEFPATPIPKWANESLQTTSSEQMPTPTVCKSTDPVTNGSSPCKYLNVIPHCESYNRDVMATFTDSHGSPRRISSPFGRFDNAKICLADHMSHNHKKRSSRPQRANTTYWCCLCKSNITPQWRYLDSRRLCNACYMRIKRHGQGHVNY